MPTVIIECEPGEVVTVTVAAHQVEYVEDPDPGEEIPEDDAKPVIFAVGGKK